MLELCRNREADLPALELVAVCVIDRVHSAIAALVDAVGGALRAVGVVGALPDHEMGREQRVLVLQHGDALEFCGCSPSTHVNCMHAISCQVKRMHPARLGAYH